MKIETLKSIITVIRNVGISIAGITFIVLMIKMTTDQDNKAKYIKLTKHLFIATILIFLSLSIIEIPKGYFGSSVEMTGGEIEEMTIGKIEDKDCQDREVVNIDGKRYVVTDTNVKLYAVNEESYFMQSFESTSGIETAFGNHILENCCILKLFSECQGTFKGFFANNKYFRDSDGFIFSVETTYEEYAKRKNAGYTGMGGR